MSFNKKILTEIDRQLRDRNRSRRYSKSLSATNRLFLPNPLLNKPSRRRIYNPNAKYFHKGGEPGHTHDEPTTDNLRKYLEDNNLINDGHINLDSPFKPLPTKETLPEEWNYYPDNSPLPVFPNSWGRKRILSHTRDTGVNYKEGGPYGGTKDQGDGNNYKTLSVKPSKIHGNGLYAEEPIKAGEPIMLSHNKTSFEEGGEQFLKSEPTHYANYYNHNEDTPNATNKWNDKKDTLYLLASKDIQPGEEITSNYWELDDPTLESPKDFRDGGPHDPHDKEDLIKEMYQRDVDIDTYNKKYTNSPHFRNMMRNAGYLDEEINDRIAAINKFSVDDHINYLNEGINYVYEAEDRDDVEGTGHRIDYNIEDGLQGWPNWRAVQAHEHGHLGVSSGRNPMTSFEKEELLRRNKTERDTAKFIKQKKKKGLDLTQDDQEHDLSEQETRADLFELRYDLAKAGIYDSSEGKEFTKEDLKDYYKMQKKGETDWNRLQRLYDNEDIIWMMNNIAKQNPEVSADALQFAEEGGFIDAKLTDEEIQKYIDGGYIVEELHEGGGVDFKKCPKGQAWNGKYCANVKIIVSDGERIEAVPTPYEIENPSEDPLTQEWMPLNEIKKHLERGEAAGWTEEEMDKWLCYQGECHVRTIDDNTEVEEIEPPRKKRTVEEIYPEVDHDKYPTIEDFEYASDYYNEYGEDPDPEDLPSFREPEVEDEEVEVITPEEEFDVEPLPFIEPEPIINNIPEPIIDDRIREDESPSPEDWEVTEVWGDNIEPGTYTEPVEPGKLKSRNHQYTDQDKIIQAILHPFNKNKRIRASFKSLPSKMRFKKRGLKKDGGIPKATNGKIATIKDISRNLKEMYPGLIPATPIVDPRELTRLGGIEQLVRLGQQGLSRVHNIDPVLVQQLAQGKSKQLLKLLTNPRISEAISDQDIKDTLFNLRINPGASSNLEDLFEREGRKGLVGFLANHPILKESREQMPRTRYNHNEFLNRFEIPSDLPSNTEGLWKRSFTTDPRVTGEQPILNFENDYDFIRNLGDKNKNLVGMLFGTGFHNPFDMAAEVSRKTNQGFHHSHIGDFITGSSSVTPDSWLLQTKRQLHALKNAERAGVLPQLMFMGYKEAGGADLLNSYLRDANISREEASGMRASFAQAKLDKLYNKYKIENRLPVMTPNWPEGQDPVSEGIRSAFSIKNRGIGLPYDGSNTMYLPHYGVVKTDYKPEYEFQHGGSLKLGDEVREDMVEELRKLGYTLEKL